MKGDELNRNPDDARQRQQASMLFWLIVLGLHGLLMGPLWPGEEAEVILLHEGTRAGSSITVDLRVDSLPRLQLISGIGPGLAAKIIDAREERKRAGLAGFPCRCRVMQIPGVPDRALIDAGPWVLPLPCPGFECRHPEESAPENLSGSSP